MHLSQVDFLRHILAECDYLLKESAENDFDEFSGNERLIKASCRSLEIIGEASSRVHPDLKSKYNYIPWREMSDLRNRIIHNYFGVDLDIVWDSIISDIPLLREWIHTVIELEMKQS